MPWKTFRNMKKVFIFTGLLLGSLCISAQNSGLFNTQGMGLSQLKPGFSVQTGTSAAFGAGAGMNSTFIAPSYSFSPAAKWKLNMGVVFSSSHLFNTSTSSPVMRSSEFPMGFNNGFQSGMFYLSGTYQYSPKLLLKGAGYFERDNFQAAMNPQAFQNNRQQGMMLGMQYSFSENFHFGAEIHIRDGNRPMNMFSQPFGQSYPSLWGY